MTNAVRRLGAALSLLFAAALIALPAAAATTEATVTVVDDAYDDGTDEPSSTVVTVGDTVTWRWSDANQHLHTVTAVDGSFDSDGECAGGSTAPCRGPGNTFEVTFDEPGTYRYRCRLVLTMVGTVEVVDDDAAAPPAEELPEDDDGSEEPAPPAEDGDPGSEDEDPRDPSDGDDATTQDPGAGTGGQEPEGEAEDQEREPSETPEDPTRSASADGTEEAPAPRTGTAGPRRLPNLSSGTAAGGDETTDDPSVAAPVDRPSFEPFPEPSTPVDEDEDVAATAVEIPGSPSGPDRGLVTGAAIASLLVSAGAVTKVVLGGMAA